MSSIIKEPNIGYKRDFSDKPPFIKVYTFSSCTSNCLSEVTDIKVEKARNGSVFVNFDYTNNWGGKTRKATIKFPINDIKKVLILEKNPQKRYCLMDFWSFPTGIFNMIWDKIYVDSRV